MRVTYVCKDCLDVISVPSFFPRTIDLDHLDARSLLRRILMIIYSCFQTFNQYPHQGSFSPVLVCDYTHQYRATNLASKHKSVYCTNIVNLYKNIKGSIVLRDDLEKCISIAIKENDFNLLVLIGEIP